MNDRPWWKTLFWCLFIIAGFTVYMMVRGQGHTFDAQVDDRYLAITVDGESAEFLERADFTSVTLMESIGEYTRLDGAEDDSFINGRCDVADVGEAQVTAYKNRGKYILIEENNDRRILALSTDKKTADLYEKLTAADETAK